MEIVGQVARIHIWHVIGAITVNNNTERVAATLVSVAQFNALPASERRLMLLHCHFQNARQAWGGHFEHGGIVSAFHRRIQQADVGAVQRGDEILFGKIKERQFDFKLLLDPVAFVGFQPVPFIDRQHEGFACIQYQAQ